MIPRAVGPMPMGSPSVPVAGPTVAGRRFRFQIAISRDPRVMARRRLAVAQELDDWVPLRIVAEHNNGSRYWVWVETKRDVSVAAAKDLVKGFPGYVPKSFRMLDAVPPPATSGPQRAR